MTDRYVRLPATCINKRGDVYAKHRFYGADTCFRCGHPIDRAWQKQREARQRRAQKKAQAA